MVSSAPDALTLVEGSTFCLSTGSGDVVPGHASGLFVRDVRAIARWELTVDDLPGEPLRADVTEPFAATVLLHVPGDPDGERSGSLLVTRHRYVGEGMREDLVLHNSTARDATCRVALAVGSDFADLFAVKEGRAHGVPTVVTPAPGRLELAAPDHGHGVTVSADGEPRTGPGTLTWTARVPARGQWRVTVTVEAVVAGRPMTLHHPRGTDVARSHPARRLRDWRHRSPGLETADADLSAVLRQSVADLGALRIFDPEHPERAVVAAGAPWFMALFGRDALLTSLMLLPLDRGLALGTLQTLAAHQGTVVDPQTEEEPGRIVHEMRFGPPSPLAPGVRDRYYGTADATALFVVVLDELLRWGAPIGEVAALLPHADRALAWIEQYGDADGDGFVEYRRATPRGLLHQGWKDSRDGINHADGRLATPPIALVEVQAYGYAAYGARAHLADVLGDPATATRCRARAADLRRRFHEAFWLPDRGTLAVALDAGKRPVDAVTSNAGHALWAGILDEEQAAAVAARLVSPELFSGWGVRTLGTSMGAYDPMSYHNGSVWPHDTALCVAGLARYGFLDEARRLATALLGASGAFGHRLPELFGGFDRAATGLPVPYPTSCAPQAWAAAAPVLVLRALLRLDPDVPHGIVRCGPALPGELVPLRLRGLRIGPADVDVAVNGSGWSIAGLEGTGLRVEPLDGAAATAHR
ncbi:glycogen debranching N-terminal domain-containing protein [Actinomycetospora chlora]|uniref:Glycogen debranching N-terminal domain-containing protein n=1 Tax=Actinomycetospora chlora TaxID=663608 RepID=A0ABP9B934_9PSEU